MNNKNPILSAVREFETSVEAKVFNDIHITLGINAPVAWYFYEATGEEKYKLLNLGDEVDQLISYATTEMASDAMKAWAEYFEQQAQKFKTASEDIKINREKWLQAHPGGKISEPSDLPMLAEAAREY